MTSLSEASGRLEEKPEASGLRDNFVLSGETVVEDFRLGVLSLTEPEVSTSCISVCACDGRVLVAIPDGAWGRLKKDRALPSSALKKWVRVAVQSASVEDRAVPSGEASLFVWLGLLSPALESRVLFGEDLDPPGIDFPVGEDGLLEIPLAQALVAVCRDHFTFMTAESEAPRQEKGSLLEGRMDKLEEGLNQLITMVGSLRSQGQPSGQPPPNKSGAAPATSPAVPPGFEDMVPGRARQALAAGVEPGALEELRGLLKLPEQQVQRRPPALRSGAQVIPESSDEEEDEAAEDDGGGSAGPLGKAVVDLAKIVKDMRKEKKQAKDKGLESILDRAEGGGSHREAGGSNRSKAAALRSLQHLLSSDPTLIYQAIEKNLQADWELNGAAPGLAVSQISARGWVEHRSRIQNYVGSVRPTWCLAGIWDCLRNNRVEEARARAALGVAMMDQMACDRGGWLLASETSLEPPPPYASFSLHTAPDAWELQHSRLVDSRWVELFLAKLKDLADYQEKQAKLTVRPRAGPDPSAKDTRPDPKQKGKGGAKGGKGKREGTEEKPGPASQEA